MAFFLVSCHVLISSQVPDRRSGGDGLVDPGVFTSIFLSIINCMHIYIYVHIMKSCFIVLSMYIYIMHCHMS